MRVVGISRSGVAIAVFCSSLCVDTIGRMHLVMFRDARVYRWTRNIHGYLALFISPFIIVFAVSGMLINHGWRPAKADAPVRSRVTIQVPDGLRGMALAQEIMRQANVSGEVEFFPQDAKGPRVWIPVVRPGGKTTINADLAAGTADIEQRKASVAEGVVYLHRSPGPHNAAIRGNWFFTRIWGVLADGAVYFLLLVLVTGIYLWTVLRPERRAGLIWLAAGVVSFAAVLSALMY